MRADWPGSDREWRYGVRLLGGRWCVTATYPGEGMPSWVAGFEEPKSHEYVLGVVRYLVEGRLNPAVLIWAEPDWGELIDREVLAS